MGEELLLSPVTVGPHLLSNRMVMPPLTRNRAGQGEVPTSSMALYYAQRAGAGLMVAEGTSISPQGVGYPRVPGLHTPEQVEGWRRVTDAVHARGGTIFVQLWHVGRQSHPSIQPGGQLPVAPSAVRIDGEIMTVDGLRPFETPRALELSEIPGVVAQYADAARNALRAGFDGVEIHGANGYLVDQFLNDKVNLRTDEYGGSVENRMRFLREVLDAVVGVWGPGKVGLRLSPSSTWMDSRDTDKKALYTAVVQTLASYPLAYLHLVEPDIGGADTMTSEVAIPSSHFRSIYPGTLIVSGNHSLESARKALDDGTADLVGFGRLFIANPDLPHRFATGAPLNQADRATFYSGDDLGYVDYATLADEVRLQQIEEAVADGRVSRERVATALSARPREHQLDSGDHFARLRVADAE
jgi:N-ethylmaleimide reductase